VGIPTSVEPINPAPFELPVTHIFCFRGTWGMLGSNSQQSPQDQPVEQGLRYELL
jgi:hypothetical protein